MFRPRILVIDDLYGRQVPGGCNRERVELCGAMLIEDVTGDQATTQRIRRPVADAVFFRGQTPAAAPGDLVQNDMDGVLEKIRDGWTRRPPATPPWALILLDLCFKTGVVTPASHSSAAGMAAGRDEDRDSELCFGRKVLERLHSAPEFKDLPVAILSSLPPREIADMYSSLGAVAFIEAQTRDASMATSLESYLWRHGLLPDWADGELFDPEWRIVGYSTQLLVALKEGRKAAAMNSNLLLRGETGTGKELLARYLHRVMRQPERPFVPVDAGTLVDTLAEDTLFGHVPGAGEGMRDHRLGAIREADGGDCYLDEVGYLSPRVQEKLMRAAQHPAEVQPLGTNRRYAVHVRFISATDRPIEKWTQDGKFNHALFGRLRGGTLGLPAVRDRAEDLPLLVSHFFELGLRQVKRTNPGARLHEISDDVCPWLQTLPWPENVRGLKAAVLSAVLEAQDVDKLKMTHFHRILRPTCAPANDERGHGGRETGDVGAIRARPGELIITSDHLAEALVAALLAEADHAGGARVLPYTKSRIVIQRTISTLVQTQVLDLPAGIDIDSVLADTWHRLDDKLQAAGCVWMSGGNPVRHTMKAKVQALNRAAKKVLVRLGHSVPRRAAKDDAQAI